MKKGIWEYIERFCAIAGGLVLCYVIMLLTAVICTNLNKPAEIAEEEPQTIEKLANTSGVSATLAKEISKVEIPKEVVKAEEPIVASFIEVITEEPEEVEEIIEEVVAEVPEEPVVEEVKADPINVGDAEFDLLCRCVQAEAGNQSHYGKQLVVDVILNRADLSGQTITDVITAPRQFSSYTDGGMEKARGHVSEDTIQAVNEELESRANYEVIAFRRDKFHDNSNWKDWEKVEEHYFSIMK